MSKSLSDLLIWTDNFRVIEQSHYAVVVAFLTVMTRYSPIQTLTLTSLPWELRCAEFKWDDKELISLVFL